MSEIPQSNALAEANPESLTELLSRDPEGYSLQDRLRLIEALRSQRARFIESENAPKAPRAKTNLSSKSSAKAEDLGL